MLALRGTHLCVQVRVLGSVRQVGTHQRRPQERSRRVTFFLLLWLEFEIKPLISLHLWSRTFKRSVCCRRKTSTRRRFAERAVTADGIKWDRSGVFSSSNYFFIFALRDSQKWFAASVYRRRVGDPVGRGFTGTKRRHCRLHHVTESLLLPSE